MLDKESAQQTLRHYWKLEKELATCTDVNNDKYIELNREYKNLQPQCRLLQNWNDTYLQLIKNQKLQQEIGNHDNNDYEMQDLITEENHLLRQQLQQIEDKIMSLQQDTDHNTHKHQNIIMEIRAGTGGKEAALFAGILYRMYTKYAQSQNWKTEVMNVNNTALGGIKEIILEIAGKDVYQQLQYESGVHRVQRIPQTESSGRVHTSAATVAILPLVSEREIKIGPKDLRIDVFRSSGPGGQSVNTTDSAVRITHIPTKIMVTQQDEKSQHQNKQKAIKILRARLFDLQIQQQNKKTSQQRKQQIGSGDRSERIRTYNFPQNRLSDHRIKYVALNLQDIINGISLRDVICALQQHYQK